MPRPKNQDKEAPSPWVDMTTACEIIERTPRRVRSLVSNGHVREHRPPGLQPKYYRPDLEKYSPAAVLAGTAS